MRSGADELVDQRQVTIYGMCGDLNGVWDWDSSGVENVVAQALQEGRRVADLGGEGIQVGLDVGILDVEGEGEGGRWGRPTLKSEFLALIDSRAYEPVPFRAYRSGRRRGFIWWSLPPN